MKKKELFFIGGILLAALILWLISHVWINHHSACIHITVDGADYGTYSLSEDQIIEINDTNVCEIKDGKAYMTEASCPDHLCIHQSAVTDKGGTIVCLPNKVIIEGEGASDEDSVDAVS